MNDTADEKDCGDVGVGSAQTDDDASPPPEFYACFSPPSSASAASATTSSAVVSSVPSRPKMRWGLWSSQDKSWMQLVRQNYEKHHRRPRTPAVATGSRDGTCTPRSPKIPLIIHHIWLGSPLPEAFVRLRDSWLSRHAHAHADATCSNAGPNEDKEGQGAGELESEWEVRLWTDADVEAFDLENRKAYEAAGNFGQKSDILRYEILLRHGGLYVDVDFLCLASFEDLHTHYDFYTGLSNTCSFELNNGLVGCRPGHPIMRDIVNRIRDTCSPPCRPPPPPSLSSSSSPPVEVAVEAEAEVERIDCGSRTCAGPVVVGDPLSALVGALGRGGGGGGGGGTTGAGGGLGLGLLAGLLGGEDRARLEQAVTVEPGSATETIVKTGPGVFTRAVMAWMIASAAGERDFGTKGKPEERVLGSTGASDTTGATAAVFQEILATGSCCSGGGGSGDSRSPSCTDDSAGKALSCTCLTRSPFNRDSHGAAGTAAATVAPPPATPPLMMVLPPSYFYPVPNNAVAAKEGSLIGDGTESGVRERAGEFFAAESLAAHLWGRSWQGKGGKPKA